MKVKETMPVISSIIVVINDLKYRDQFCTIEVTCNARNDDNREWSPTTAECEDPYFIMGSSFWEKQFGKKQSNRIKKLCEQAIKDYLEKENND